MVATLDPSVILCKQPAGLLPGLEVEEVFSGLFAAMP